MYERPDNGDRAVVICLDMGDPDYAESVEEISRLAESANVRVVDLINTS